MLIPRYWSQAEPLPELPAGIRYWFAADHGAYTDADGLVLAGDGDPIRRWQNLGSGEDAEQPLSDNRPIFKTGGDNGRPYVQATAANMQYFAGLAITRSGSIPISEADWNGYANIAMVMKHDSPGDGKFRAILGYFGDDGQVSALCQYYTSGSNVIRSFKNEWTTRSFADGQTHLVIGSHNYLSEFNWSDEESLYVEDNSTANAPSSTITGMDLLRGANLGTANTPSDGAYWNGRLYEFIMWQNIGKMSSDDHAIVRDYLKAKYGL